VTLTPPNPKESIIEPFVIDRAPRYYVLGGLVLQELSRQYLREWGMDWVKKAPDRFVYFDRYQSELFANDPRERIVILSQVLPSPCTIGYEDLSSLVVEEINGVKLRSLADIEIALAASRDGFHRIRFPDGPREIVLDAAEVEKIAPELMRAYGLPAVKRLDEQPAEESGPAPAKATAARKNSAEEANRGAN